MQRVLSSRLSPLTPIPNCRFSSSFAFPQSAIKISCVAWFVATVSLFLLRVVELVGIWLCERSGYTAIPRCMLARFPLFMHAGHLRHLFCWKEQATLLPRVTGVLTAESNKTYTRWMMAQWELQCSYFLWICVGVLPMDWRGSPD